MKTCASFFLLICITLLRVAGAQTLSEASPPQQSAVHHKKLSDKDDVTRIGHRNIGHQGLGNWYSINDDISLGKAYAASIETDLKLSSDSLINDYINRIGQRVAQNSDAQVALLIKVIDSEDVNAFSLPGGFLYVNNGVLLATENEAELAGVMAHEIAHIAARHAAREMTRANILQILSLSLIFSPGGLAAEAIHLIGQPAMQLEKLKFSRNFEAEADYLALEYAYAAGYDPAALISFLERVSGHEENTGGLHGLFCTHPQISSRIKKCQEEIARILPARREYVLDTSEFEDAKAHLVDMQRHATAKAPEESDRPILQRKHGLGKDPRTPPNE